MKTLDVGRVIDEGRWSGYQKLLIIGAASAIILDGIDFQLLGNSVPALMREWSLPRPAFATALALGPLGMMIGSIVGGTLADRIGRRKMLLLNVLSFGIITLASAASNTLAMLSILRFLTGLGLGGAMPNAAALVSEYVPKRNRGFAVTLTIVCFPGGGALAAVLAGQVVPQFGWRALFLIGGAIPLALAAVLFWILPESPRFLASHRERWTELIGMLRRMGHNVPVDAAFTDGVTPQKTDVFKTLSTLFGPEYRRDTTALFLSFFFCLMANNIGFAWIVAMLTGAGFAQIDASSALAAFNFGGVGGAILGALIIQKLGSRITMVSLSALAVVSALIMVSMPLDPTQKTGLIVMFGVTGGLLNAVQTTMYALATNVYPTAIRGTGVGTAVAFGRIGQLLASFVGSFALERGGSAGYFSSWAVTMGIVLLSLAVVSRHIGRTSEDVLKPVESRAH